MRRIYYGWYIVVACNCVAFITAALMPIAASISVRWAGAPLHRTAPAV